MTRASSASFLPDAATSGERSAERRLLAAVVLAVMLAPLNSTMIAVALPRIAADLGADVGQAGWLVLGYLVAMAALQPVGGKLGDRLGRRPLILGGVAWFGLASLAALAAESLPALLLARIQQGVAGALALPNAAAVLREAVPAERRAGRFGVVNAAVGIAAAAGPPLGGLLIGVAGWPAIFAVNLLLVVPALLLGWRALRRTPGRTPAHPFDLTGAILLAVTLAGAAALLARGSALSPWLGAVVAGLGALFVWRESRHPDPVLQPRFFGRRPLAAASAAVALSNLAMYAVLLATPVLLSARAGWTSGRIGLALTALSVGLFVCSPIGGRLADRLGRRWPTLAGLCLVTLGLLPLAVVGAAIGTLGLLLGLTLAGAGLGLSAPGLQTAAVEAVAAREAGVAAGLFSTSRYLGSILAASALARFLSPAGDGAAGFAAVCLVAVAAALLSALVSLGLPDRAA